MTEAEQFHRVFVQFLEMLLSSTSRYEGSGFCFRLWGRRDQGKSAPSLGPPTQRLPWAPFLEHTFTTVPA